MQKTGRTAYQAAFGVSYNGKSFPFGCEVIYLPAYKGKHGELSERIPPIGEKTLPGLFIGYHRHPGGLFSGDYLVIDQERYVSEMLPVEVPIVRVKDVWNPHESFKFPIRMGILRHKPPGTNPDIPPEERVDLSNISESGSTVRGGDPMSRFTRQFTGISGSSTDMRVEGDTCTTAEDCRDYWSTNGDILTRHHITPRDSLFVPHEGECPLPLKYLDSFRHTELKNEYGEVERRDNDVWTSEADATKVSYWFTGKTVFDILRPVPPPGFVWARDRLTKHKSDSQRVPYIYPEVWRDLT